MKKIFAVILMIGVLNFLPGCMMLMHDADHGQGHHGGKSTETGNGSEGRGDHGH